MATWKPLQPGDKIAIIAPASPSEKKDLTNGIEVLRGWGLIPTYSDDILKKDFYYASSIDERFSQLKTAFSDPEIKAIYSLRGGYGSQQLLARLTRLKKPRKAKPLIGLSDISALHLFLNQIWRWPSLHSIVLTRLGDLEAPIIEKEELKQILFGKKNEVSFRSLVAVNEEAKKVKTYKAPVVGGNLSVIQSLSGTDFEFKTRNRILFFEDIGERGYRVDRLLTTLQMAGTFKSVQAVVFGDFTDCNEKDGKNLVWPTIEKFFEKSPFPVLKGLPSGHGKLQKTIPLFTSARLRTGPKASLTIATGSSQ